MEQLTVEKAKEFCKNILEGIQDEEEREFIYLHSKKVVETALLIAKGKKVDEEKLQIAGWVHDTGKAVEKENHAEHSIELLEKEFEIDEVVKDCILNHGSSAEPKTKEGKIIQLADKAFMLNPELLEFVLARTKGNIAEKYIKFFKKISGKTLTILERFEN